MSTSLHFRSVGVLLALLAALTGCAKDDTTCGAGAALVDGQCVVGDPTALCGPGTVAENGLCVPAPDADTSDGPCVPQCDGRECGSDGCGGTCGTCGDGLVCTGDRCEPLADCTPSCDGHECGPDGCGGQCGECTSESAPECSVITYTCGDSCIPDCIDRVCGPDGCGGDCGDCDDAAVCIDAGRCVPSEWTCDKAYYGAADACDCDCGVADPDCTLEVLETVNCGPDEVCTEGVCLSTVPEGWTCLSEQYGEGTLCDCGCGVPDPDCDSGELTVAGCEPGQTCDSTSAICVECVPSCDGKECGSDGCGGDCAACPEDPENPGYGLACVDHQCVSGCNPTPAICATAECGDDGCGGSCGTCDPGYYCNVGSCEIVPGKSCAGYCNGEAPGGCGCDLGCVVKNDCCGDYEAVCTCTPECADRECGPDGCGGECGSCEDPSTPYCSPDGQCASECTPQCDGKECGDDGCGGECESCDAGSTCNGTFRCVPESWACFDGYYGDGEACDCGCGSTDPDCAISALAFGCPDGASCDQGSGFCAIDTCDTTADCENPTWCVGSYLTESGARKGTCAPPNPAGAAADTLCWGDEACATGICAAGVCRNYCTTDGDCGDEFACVGIPLMDELTEKSIGAVSVCDFGALLAESCGSQDDCEEGTCLAVLSPVGFEATYRCGVVVSDAFEGTACAAAGDCGLGLACVEGTCGRACPGGDADCPPGASCTEAVLFDGISPSGDDDVVVNACAPTN